jgi:hypothetical protein
MRKQLLGSFVAGLMVFGAGSALADPGAETGEGVDQECEVTDASGNTTTEPCPTPTDPTAGDENMAPAGPVAVGGHQDGVGGGVYVQAGNEGEANSVGRASLSGSQADGSAGVYVEDYTEGNQGANAVESGNEATGCRLLAPAEGETCGAPGSDDSSSDAAYIHN